MTENKNVKAEIKRLQENTEKLTTDMDAIQKKTKMQTIPKTTKKITTLVNKNTNYMETNKENIIDNEQMYIQKAPVKEIVALEAQVPFLLKEVKLTILAAYFKRREQKTY